MASRKTRGRSVPAAVYSSQSSPESVNGDNSKALTTLIIPPSSSISPISPNGFVTTNRHSSRLHASADAMAHMTIEFNIRSLHDYVRRLEREVGALKTSTKEDGAFRESHGARLQNICQEIAAVKQRMAEIEDPEWNRYGRIELQRCKTDVDASIGQLRREMGELKGLVIDVSSTLDQLPSAAEIEALMRCTRLFSSTTESSHRHASSTLRLPYFDSRETLRSQATIKKRIEEAFKSTRRWNYYHKTTKFNEETFIAYYLERQKKRDAQLAVYIQKAILLHIWYGGRLKARSRPRNIREFCQNLVWKDVLETAGDVLVRNVAWTAAWLEGRRKH